ncbi:TonB-dependent receptor [Bacteroides sp. 519]|uniref:SusC/RagA family TonB-linked outer membrane protein n=1 Tax=Bacteroides sp. 519 TaxID=2302937 RepID=UPI0013D7B3D7|nr:TonB-dependent receptor [Bacteroides sp. 519]NDV57726.1 TonB-dependent receptor [Bacteroides sp. 519]
MCKVQMKNKGMWTHVVVLVLFLMNSTWAFAQTTVTGTVADTSGEPLIGVNVSVKGTTTGTITDVDGKFSLNVDRGQTLVFSYIGYISQEVEVQGSTLNVTLKDDSQVLSDVVVIGYGTMTRKDVTSSITTINSKDMNVGVFSNPAQMLQGKVPGLTITQDSNPNSNPSVTLRGASTLRDGAAQEPYYVVDGVPGVSLALIAPEDIESIDILRDASATAIYGSKAANGVIIVTTKRGKAGHTSINYSGYVAFDQASKRWDMMTSDEYRTWAQANNKAIDPNDDLGYNTDWQKEVQRTGVSHNHNISISGGSEKTVYNASINYMNNEGIIMGTDLKRYIGRAFVETKGLNDRLKLSFNVNASVTERNDVMKDDKNEGRSVYDAMVYYLPFSPVKNENGSWFERPTRSQYYNPVSLIKENTDFTKTKRLQATAKASLNILDGLNYDVSLSYQNVQDTYSYYNSSNSMLAQGANGKASRSSVESEKKIMEMYFNYDKTFNLVHKVGAMAGYSWEESNDNDGFQVTASNFFSDALLYHNMGLSNNSDRVDYGGWNLSTLRMISFFGRVNYSYNSKYLFQATLRRDGSSAFGKNNRWATFPSASLAWRASEEDFIKNLNVFDDLKFRVGYGVSGNSLGFDVFSATQVYGSTGWTTNAAGNPIQTLSATRNANPNLKWERTSMFNIGLDFGFFNNRLSGTIEYYQKNTKDLIADYQVSTTQYLYGWMTTNVGEVSNKGIELTINATPVQTKDFTWNTTLNLSHNRNRVESISNDEYSVGYMDKAYLNGPGQTAMPSQRIMEGCPIGQFYTWQWAGYNDEGISTFYVRDPETGERTGETTTKPGYDDLTKTGSAQPKLNFGWNNTLTYKNFTLTAFFQGVTGNKIMNATRARLSNIGDAGIRNLLSSVAETEKGTDINAHYLSDRYLEDGSYLRLSSLSLGYNFGKLGNWVNNLRVYATCNNVFVITGYKGMDPEITLGGIEPGIDNRKSYPKTRTFMLGMNINF